MSEECRNDCIPPLQFPKRLDNRPGLSRIDYRIGTYADIREALLRALNQDPILTNWTHREADDPGIALLEGASILGDILTFYQELYANEAYLRTAQWRENVGDLVRLLGYRLSPGLGGKATFAFEVKGDKPVVVPAGFPIKAQLEGMEKQVDFETEQEMVAYPHLSQFHLYRPRRPRQDYSQIRKGLNRLEVESVFISGLEGGEEVKDVASIREMKLLPGDRIILISSGEILIVSKVRQVLDRTIIEFEGSLRADYYGQIVTAYRIGRTFRHFGHNAPAFTTEIYGRHLKQDPTDFDRLFYGGHEKYCILSDFEMPLDTVVDDLAMGNALVCQGFWRILVTGIEVSGLEHTIPMDDPFTIVRTINDLRSDALTWGSLTGSSTVVTLDDSLTEVPDPADVRKLRFHEVKGPKMNLRALTEWEDEIAEDKLLFYWGTYDEVLNLEGRSLILCKDEVLAQQVTINSTRKSFDEAHTERERLSPTQWLWPISLDKPIVGFSPQDFDEENPKVTVYGNLVEATQGKREKEAVLGNGNNQEIFQTFKLPKSPLTYFRSEEETPPEVPDLEVYVNDRLWTRVPSFFGHGPKEEIYIVREDSEGNSWVQFGDGKTGARLPSGIQNVVARYRTGTGAFGALKEGATVQAGARLNHLHKIHLPGIVTGADAPESGENAREAAPGKVQSLGRLVSLQDFEAEALAIAGVCRAKARWALHDNAPAVVITVLMDSGRKEEHEEVRSILSEANRSRGAGRFPIIVNPGVRQYAELKLKVGYDPAFRQDLLKKSIKEALGMIGDEGNGIDGSKGLFSVQKRQFGQPEYATRIEGTVQNIKGVVWARVSDLELLRGDRHGSSGPDHSGHPGRRTKKLECKDDALLCLRRADFEVKFKSVSPTEVSPDD